MLEQLSIQQRFRVLLVFSLACFALWAGIVYYTLSELRVNGPIYVRIMQGQDLVADILPPPEYILESYLVALQLNEAVDEAGRRRLADRLQQLKNEYDGRYRYWLGAGLKGELASRFLKDAHEPALAFYDTAFRQLIPALQREDRPAAARALARLGAAYEQQRQAIDQVVRLAHQRNRQDEAAAQARIEVMVVSLTLVFALSMIVFCFIFKTIQRSIAQPLMDAIRITRKIAAGDWGHRIEKGRKDEAGHLLAAIKDIVRNTRTELAKSEKMAALGSLVAGVSHELNTPVGNGLLAVSALHDELNEFRIKIADGVRRSALDAFLQSVETGSDIATRNLQRAADLMRSFKQVAVDRASSQRRPFLLHQVIDETQMTLQPMLKKAGCRIVLDIAPAIQLDSFPGPLGQVISNMIENAVKHGYADGSPGTIRVGARLVDRGGRVVISVSDHGCGIPEATQAHVFEPFFTTQLGKGGSGLGLHISHNIVYGVLSGGIQLRSETGRGTTFEVTIPLVAPEDKVAA